MNHLIQRPKPVNPMSSFYIPYYMKPQLKRMFMKDFTMDRPMIPRKFYCNGTQCSIVIKFPKPKSNFVMTAEILVANEAIDTKWSSFNKMPLVFDSGTRIVYQFTDWSHAEEFIDRLPRRMPSNKVTVMVSALGKPMSIHDFLDHIDYGCNHLECTYQPVSGLKKLKDELRDFGIAA